MAFNYIQTFYLNSQSVAGSAEISITSIELYFKNKPLRTNNNSGVNSPGVTVYLCPATIDGVDPSTSLFGSIKKNSFDEIASSINATEATKFTFNNPITLNTNRYYGIVIIFDDADYDLWYIKQGDKLLGTTTSASSSNFNGGLVYENSNSLINPKSDIDLKFKVNVAKYTSNSTTVQLISDNYEFFTMNSISNNFQGGEAVYKEVSNSTGFVLSNTSSNILIGSNTLFESEITSNTYVVITDGSITNTDIRFVSSISSNTSLTLDLAPSFDAAAAVIKVSPTGFVYYTNYVNNSIILSGSTANTSQKFEAGDTIIGEISGSQATIATVDDFSVDVFFPEIIFTNPSVSQTTTDYLFAYSNGSSYISNESDFSTMNPSMSNEVKDYDAILVSRSKEVDSAGTLFDGKSAILRVNMAINANSFNGYESPAVYQQKIDILTFQNKINNVSTNEHLDNGASDSKYISKKIVLANNSFAEDILSYITAYKPTGTDIKVYARIHNSNDNDAFDDKYWTELKVINNIGLESSLSNSSDYIEYTYGFPQYPNSEYTLSGVFSTTASNNVILSSNNQTSVLANNDLIKIYDPLFAETNHQIATVLSVNSTSITIGDLVSNTGLVGNGLMIDKLKLSQTAFKNVLSDNVVRYFNSSSVEFDNYDSFAIKIVMLSNNSYLTPHLEDVRTIAVSA